MITGNNSSFRLKAVPFLLIFEKNLKSMGIVYSLLTSVLLFIHISGEIPYTALENAFSSNDSSAIASFGKDKILLHVLGNEGAYSQSQSALILKDFFTKKPGTIFKFILKGKETNEGVYAVGNYTSKSEVFRITILFKKVGSDYKIESLTIEKN